MQQFRHIFIAFFLKSVLSNPFDQRMPTCNTSKQIPPKRFIDRKGLVCTMIKDEEGFLSEFLAFYLVQGFDHFIFYDNNSSTSQSLRELDPWIANGTVTVKNAGSIKKFFHVKEVIKRKGAYALMRGHKSLDLLNAVTGIDCKLYGVNNGYSIYLGVDIDEYVMPKSSDKTLFDELFHWFRVTKNRITFLNKYNFPSVPHILEPVNLLTMEAYQTRYPVLQKMNYYVTTGPKLAILLSSDSELQRPSNNTMQTFLTRCCFIHGCGYFEAAAEVLQIDSVNCTALFVKEYSSVWRTRKRGGNWITPPVIFHYARSLEKFAMKQQTWDKKLSSGNDSVGNPQGLSLHNYLHRAVGHRFDDSALRWSCAVREVLRKFTGEPNYLRPGDNWYRNIEFGKFVNDPSKRGRYGNGLKKKITKTEWNTFPVGDTYQAAHKHRIGT